MPTGIREIDDPIYFENLVNAIIQQESSGDPKAFNKRTGAKGLMQLTKDAWADVIKARLPYYDMSFNDPNAFDPVINKEFGEIYLRDILPQYLTVKKIPLTLENLLASYNWGAGNVSKVRYNKSKYPTETQKYIRDISKELQEILKRKKLIDSL